MFSVKGLFPAGRRIAGVDIGSSRIKLVELKDTPEGLTLQCFAQVALERGTVEAGLIRDHAALVKKIKELFRVSRYRGKNVIIALSGHFVMIKKAGFRRMEEGELRDFIIDEAGEYLPFDDIRDVNFDLHICSQRENDPGQMEVIIVAAKKEITERYSYAIEKAGARAAVMDVDSFALETAYEENYDFATDDIIALVNIGASITNINIVRDEESVFTRNIKAGGDSITQALQSKLGISFEEAEMIKLEGSGGDSDTGERILDYLEPIFLEIGRSFDYFSSTVSGSPIGRILLSGGCAGIPGIADAMKDLFHCDVEIFNPFKNIRYDKNVFSPSYLREIGPIAAVGVGLALRSVEGS
ncbi:MAG: type IV pilus assembly protein PilM [Deltaproteobacteria bacterium]|nr:type IV pilus assembly protein PilM [Deltaproteobacteria bacterium]MBW2672929.1 type IV pilus assembly protein PilM [Deltaproteobacteria bacterium]